MDLARSSVVIFFLLVFQAGYAQDSEEKYSESEVKAAVEEIGVLNICPDRTLLELAELEVEDCRNRLSKLKAVCWHIIDSVVPDYEVEKNEDDKEVAKNQIISLSLVYSSCIRSEILKGIVKKRRESGSD
jgi:hypothetical protein